MKELDRISQKSGAITSLSSVKHGVSKVSVIILERNTQLASANFIVFTGESVSYPEVSMVHNFHLGKRIMRALCFLWHERYRASMGLFLQNFIPVDETKTKKKRWKKLLTKLIPGLCKRDRARADDQCGYIKKLKTLMIDMGKSGPSPVNHGHGPPLRRVRTRSRPVRLRLQFCPSRTLIFAVEGSEIRLWAPTIEIGMNTKGVVLQKSVASPRISLIPLSLTQRML